MRAQSRLLTTGVMLGLCFFLSAPAFASEYTVVKGDCLWKIAQTKLDSGPRWVEIYKENRDQIRNPDLIYPDQVFTIPDGAADLPVPEQAEQAEPAETVAADVAAAETTAAAEGAFAIRPLVGTPTDYSDPDNWASLPDITKRADTLYLYPTAYINTDADAPKIVPVTDETMRKGALQNIELNCGVFSESTNVFVPYYRQSNLGALTDLDSGDFVDFQMQEQRTDVYAALDYYFEHYNDGRPYILAGHSQGSAMLKIVLREYMQAHPAYYERMIAAYVLGYSITNEDMEFNPNLKFAEGADDTGVIISWNVEGPDNSDNCCVLPGALVINPINWRRDETYAYTMYNQGSRIVNPNTGKVDDIIPGVADAELNLERGVVVCYAENLSYIRVDNYGLPNMFGERSYHNGDYGFYYYNLKENVGVRTDAWFARHPA